MFPNIINIYKETFNVLKRHTNKICKVNETIEGELWSRKARMVEFWNKCHYTCLGTFWLLPIIFIEIEFVSDFQVFHEKSNYSIFR